MDREIGSEKETNINVKGEVNPQKEGNEMLAIKKESSFTTAKISNVIKAIIKSNKKHSKMMSKLAK